MSLHICKDLKGFTTLSLFWCLYQTYTSFRYFCHSPSNGHLLHRLYERICIGDSTFHFCFIFFPVTYLYLLTIFLRFAFISLPIISWAIFTSIHQLLMPVACILKVFWQKCQKRWSFSAEYSSFSKVQLLSMYWLTPIICTSPKIYPYKSQNQRTVFLSFSELAFLGHCNQFGLYKSTDILVLIWCKYVFLFLLFAFILALRFRLNSEIIHVELCKDFSSQGLLLCPKSQIRLTRLDDSCLLGLWTIFFYHKTTVLYYLAP